MFLVFVSFWNLPHLHKNKTINKGIRTIAHDFVRIKVVSMDGRIFRSCYCCCCFLLVVHKIISNEDTNTGGGGQKKDKKERKQKRWIRNNLLLLVCFPLDCSITMFLGDATCFLCSIFAGLQLFCLRSMCVAWSSLRNLCGLIEINLCLFDLNYCWWLESDVFLFRSVFCVCFVARSYAVLCQLNVFKRLYGNEELGKNLLIMLVNTINPTTSYS